MKIHFFLLFVLSSCATINNILGIDFDKAITKGLSRQEVQKIAGNPKIKFITNEQEYLLYEKGYVILNQSAVSFSSNYNIIYRQGTELSSYQVIGQNLEKIINQFGCPQEIYQNQNKIMLIFINGSIIFEDERMVQIIDRKYDHHVVFKLKLNAFSDYSDKKTSRYFITSGATSINPNDFLFKEVKNYLTSSMKKEDSTVVDSIENADYIVFLNFGISEPKEDIEVISRPIYIPQYLPGTTTNIFGSSGSQIGSIQTLGQWTTQYAGQKTQTIKTISYNRWLNIEAVSAEKLKKSKEIVPVWKVLVKSEGESGDLRYILPVLMFAGSTYLNQDSKLELSFKTTPNAVNKYIYESEFLSKIKK